VDRLEALLGKGWRVPLASKTMIDEDGFLDIVDQMRIAIPEEIRQAKKIVQDRERVIAQAQEEADRIIKLANEEAGRLVSAHAITKAAQEQAMQIEQQANAAAATTRQGADEYTTQKLTDLQAQLAQFAQQIANMQTQVSNGLNLLAEQRSLVAPPPEFGQDIS
jgi:F0F1-type ATP synthase membrane subunit b/b'